jgi:hypothetical protein
MTGLTMMELNVPGFIHFIFIVSKTKRMSKECRENVRQIAENSQTIPGVRGPLRVGRS